MIGGLCGRLFTVLINEVIGLSSKKIYLNIVLIIALVLSSYLMGKPSKNQRLRRSSIHSASSYGSVRMMRILLPCASISENLRLVYQSFKLDLILVFVFCFGSFQTQFEKYRMSFLEMIAMLVFCGLAGLLLLRKEIDLLHIAGMSLLRALYYFLHGFIKSQLIEMCLF